MQAGAVQGRIWGALAGCQTPLSYQTGPSNIQAARLLVECRRWTKINDIPRYGNHALHSHVMCPIHLEHVIDRLFDGVTHAPQYGCSARGSGRKSIALGKNY